MQAPLAALAQSTQDELAQLQTDPGSVLSDALAKISPKDIGLLKSFKRPPGPITAVSDAVLIVLQRAVKPAEAVEVLERREYTDSTTGKAVQGKHTVLKLAPSWDHAREMMGDIVFIPALRDFDGAKVNDETAELLYPYVAAADFHPDEQRKVARAVEGMGTWVRALMAQRGGVEALVAHVRARAVLVARPLPAKPMHPLARLLLLGSESDASALFRLRGRTDELRSIFECVLHFEDHTAGGRVSLAPPRVTASDVADAWADRSPPCPPLEVCICGSV